MRKIISLYQRNYETDRIVRDEVVPGAEWVLNGEGVATRKYDGTCCMVEGGKLFKRREIKPGDTPPEGFVPANNIDEVTGKQQGWMPVGEGPDDKYHREAFTSWSDVPDGTYELCGPNIQGNPEGYQANQLIAHDGSWKYPDFPRTFEAIKSALEKMDIEGIVWHHPDGRMVKIKRKDFGFKHRPVAAPIKEGE